MSDEHPWGWLISVKGWQTMATKPAPYFACTDQEKDWYLVNSTQPELYDVERARDPLTPEQRAEADYFIQHGRFPSSTSGV